MRKIDAAVISIALALPILVANAQAAGDPSQTSPAPPSHAATTPPAAAIIPAEEQPSKEQLAKLFEVMRLRDQMQNVMRMIPAVVSQQVQSQMAQITDRLAPGTRLTATQQAHLKELTDKYIEKSMTVYTVEDMIADMTSVYQHHVSREDVEALIAFYSSPAGQHLLDAQPAIMAEYMPIVMQRQKKATDALIDEMQKDLEDFSKSVAADRGAPTPR